MISVSLDLFVPATIKSDDENSVDGVFVVTYDYMLPRGLGLGNADLNSEPKLSAELDAELSRNLLFFLILTNGALNNEENREYNPVALPEFPRLRSHQEDNNEEELIVKEIVKPIQYDQEREVQKFTLKEHELFILERLGGKPGVLDLEETVPLSSKTFKEVGTEADAMKEQLVPDLEVKYVEDSKAKEPVVLEVDLGFVKYERVVLKAKDPEVLKELEFVREVKDILEKNEIGSVKLCEEGVGGTYFIQDEEGNSIGVFKPIDEEPGAENNPKEMISNPLLPPGGGTKREIAAYVLDRGFAGVPQTVHLKNVTHNTFSRNGKGKTKSGSLQRFTGNIGDSGSMGASRFSVEDVHKVGILDIRLFNMDRNSENLLIQKTSDPKTKSPIYSLIPIDHTYILPPTLDSAWFEWQHWKQSKEPFSKSHLSYIRSLDINQDAKILRSLDFDPASIRTMKICTTLLKTCAENGLTLFEIASMISRKIRSKPSQLELIVKQTEEELKKYPETTIDDDAFLTMMKKIIISNIADKIKKA